MAAKKRPPKRPPPIKVYADLAQRTEITRKATAVGLTPARFLLMAGLERPERGGVS